MIRNHNSKNLALVLALAAGIMGCDLKGGGSSETPEGPPKPEYERAFDEFADIPNQITAHVEWAAEPIDNAIHLADEIAALRTKLNIDAETFAGMCTVALKDGKIEIGAQAELQAAKAEIEALLNKIKQTGKDLQGLPDRVKVAGKGISKLVTSTPKLVIQSGKELSGSLSIATGDQKLQIQGDIETVKQLPNEVKTQALAAKDVLATLPDKAQTAMTNLVKAMKGEPYEPLETTAKPGDDASADTGTQVASAGGTTGGAGGTTGGTGGPPPAPSGKAPPPPKKIPEALIARRVKQLETDAAAMSKRGDWMSASDAYEEALTLDPENWGIAFKLGDAATRAKDCARAQLYLDRFAKYADPNEFLDKIQAAKRALGELQTFECPARTAQEEALVAETLSLEAKALAAEGDWTGAALTYHTAYERVPTDPLLAFEVGVAAWKAQACGDAVSYFYHFIAVADAKKHRRQIKEANGYIDKAETGACKALDRGAMDTRARELYSQGQERELALDYLGAAGKYERAYELLPENHALAFRIGEAYWSAQYCSNAEPYYRTFIARAEELKFMEEFSKANNVLARIGAHGCPNALWDTSIPAGGGAAASGGGGGGGASSDGPPPAPEAGPPASDKKGGSAHCSIDDDRGPAGAIGFGLLVLASLVRRRREA